MPERKSSDDGFLDGLRVQGDPQADATIARLSAEHGERAVGPTFGVLQANDDPLPADAPDALRAFMAATGIPDSGSRAVISPLRGAAEPTCCLWRSAPSRRKRSAISSSAPAITRGMA